MNLTQPFASNQTSRRRQPEQESRVARDALWAKDAYPEKPTEGLGAPGPIAMRYALAVECHDMHTRRDWEEAIRVMSPYYEAILGVNQGERM